MTYGLGRLPAPDPRDARFPLRMPAGGPEPVPVTQRYHPTRWWGDQGSTPQCVGYAWAHWLDDGPVYQGPTHPVVDPTHIYDEAQKIDEWDGEGYEGTSVRAGAKVLQSLGYIKEYRWAESLQDIIDAVKYIGPVVMGTNWYENMFDVTAYPWKIDVSGALAGGHAWVLNGVSERTGRGRGKNSWSQKWARKGSFFIALEDVERLLLEDGEACIGIEQGH